MADNKIVPDDKKEPDHSTYTTTPNDLDPGLTGNVADCAETPKMFLNRVLVEGEVVISNFDCKFPGEFLPIWKLIALVIGTLGLYSFILLFRFIRRFCYRIRCCTPDTVHFAFGKMVITNKGRIICWKEEIYQKKIKQEKYKGHCWCLYIDGCIAACYRSVVFWCIKPCFPKLCQAPVNYAFAQESRMYRASDVKQITQYMTNEANCLFCCNEFTCGIEVSFNQYNHGSNHLTIVTKSEDTDYGAEAQSAVSSSSSGSYYQWARGVYGVTKESSAFQLIRALKNGLEDAMGATSNLNTIYIVSDTGDRVHNGDIKAILQDMCSIHKQLLACLPNPKVALVQQVMNKGAAGSKFEFTEKFSNVTIVKNDGTVSIPAEWVPLLPGEVIMATTGEVPRMNIIKWIKCCCTLGYWYCKYWRLKKFTRSALVLTNKRLITVDIYERSGTVPMTLTNFSIQVRSFILGSVKSGFIQSTDKLDLSAGMECDGGCINVDFSASARKALPFAHAMQMSVARVQSKMEESILAMKTKYAEDSQNKDVDWNMIPLLSNETGVDFFNGEDVWEPFGQGKRVRYCCDRCYLYCGCWKKIPVDNVCSTKTCSTMCFPLIPLLFCCCLRPFKIKTDFLVTDMSIIRYARKFNRGICGLLCGGNMPCQTNDSFMISWQPINTFQGFSISVFGAGTENWQRRCCAWNMCGRFCCPIGSHNMTLGIDFEGKYQFELKKSSMNKSWVKDENLNRVQQLLSMFSIQLQKETCDQCDIEAGLQVKGGGPGSTRRVTEPMIDNGGIAPGNGSLKEPPRGNSSVKEPPPPGFVPPLASYAPAGYEYTVGASTTQRVELTLTLGPTAPMEYSMDR